MNYRGLLCWVMISLSLVRTGRCVCGQPSPVVSVKETDGNGTLIFNITKDPSDTVTFTLKSSIDLAQQYHTRLKSDYFRTEDQGTYYVLELSKELDLEAIYQIMGNAILTTIPLVVTCQVSYEVLISNQEVNERPITFLGNPYSVNVSELDVSNYQSTDVGDIVFSLQDKVEDFDKPSNPDNYGYTKRNYTIHQFDGFNYFDVNFKGGGISVARKLDYEAMQTGQKFFVLNIEARDRADDKALTSSATVTIHVIDSDDQKPRFKYPDCPTPCTAPRYEAIVELDDTGVVDVQPLPINAVDQDTLQASVNYTFETANDLFTIDAHTGAVTQIKSVRQSGLPNKEFRLVVRATKMTPNALSDIAILNVEVKERMPTYNGTSETDENLSRTNDEGNNLLIPLIVLGVVLFLLIVVVIIIGLTIRHKHKQAMIIPEDTKSEPATEEEDLGTDRSDHWNNGVSTSKEQLVPTEKGIDLLPTPGGRGNLLPPLPLRDSATETESPGKKKRSRRRNKNKAPEIFDGTKEYNMGADPEFFDSSDKSRVKRSHRSYDNKTDPMYWIKVPNDQNDTEGKEQ